MLKFEIHSTDYRTMSGTKNGRPWTMFKQEAYAYLLSRDGKQKPHPDRTEINLDKDEHGNPKVYAPGVYQLHPASFHLDQYGGLAVAPKLVPAK